MKQRVRRRVDWDEELRKTERIRRKGLFISALGFGVAAVFIVGASRLNKSGVELGRKVVFTFCFLLAMFLVRGVLRRRERLRREKEEREEALELRRYRAGTGVEFEKPEETERGPR
jgi:membrane protein implicated in regulation of membrane protease activity